MTFTLLTLALAATPAPAATPTPVLTVRAAGDVMLGTEDPPGYLPPDDANDSLGDVRDLLRDADLTFVNLEGPLCDDGESSKCKTKKTCYAFRVPTRYVEHLADAGVDLASTANNHAGDFGEVCRRSTEAVLDKHGIAWSGPKGTVGSVERNGLKIGLVAFHTSGSCNDVNDTASAKAIVAEQKKTHDLVIVSFHGGAEGPKFDRVVPGAEMYLGENRGDLRTFTHAVVDAGADLVIGHGPHVLRGMELYKGHLIAYSLGNFATYGRFNLAGTQALGAILHVALAKDGAFVSGKILPTVQVDKGIPKKDSQLRAVAKVRELCALDFPKTAPAISEAGEISVP
jgi:poly-gamma-glutamate capsule biosynthesis protein CapA/YwtB (metallophosphatase superfamily)